MNSRRPVRARIALTIEAHVKAKQVALSRAIANRKKVYLDLNFWIAARDAAAGVRVDAPAQMLLHHLRRGVAQGKLVCPIGDTFFMELMKQPFSEHRRIGMARLVDELSLGISMIPSYRRVATEISIFVHTLLGRGPILHPMQELVWTKVCHVLGESYPVLAGIDDGTQLYLQKGFIDRLWDSSLTQIVELIGDSWDTSADYMKLSAETNRERDRHADEITSFARAYDIEIRGAIDIAGPLAAEVLCGIGEDNGYSPPNRESAAWRTTENLGKNMLLHALKREGTGSLLRTLHIEASLHAAMRVDKQRRFKPNDFYDFHHASAALAYCGAFLTERPLHELVARDQLGLEAINGCTVVSNLDDGVALLRLLAA